MGIEWKEKTPHVTGVVHVTDRGWGSNRKEKTPHVIVVHVTDIRWGSNRKKRPLT
jgi:hypothetical protein